jgi:hypothetical protein
MMPTNVSHELPSVGPPMIKRCFHFALHEELVRCSDSATLSVFFLAMHLGIYCFASFKNRLGKGIDHEASVVVILYGLFAFLFFMGLSFRKIE